MTIVPSLSMGFFFFSINRVAVDRSPLYLKSGKARADLLRLLPSRRSRREVFWKILAAFIGLILPADMASAQAPNAWQISDNSTTTSLSYQTDLPALTQQAATNGGWSYTVTSRFVGDAGSGSQTMLMIYGDGVRRWEILWSLSGGDLQSDVYSSGGMHLVTSGGTGTNSYHAHQIIYDPTNRTASYLVDGQIVVSNWTGDTASWPAGRVAWGSGSAGGIGTMNFQAVSFATTNGVAASYDAGTAGNPAIAPDPTNSPFGWTPTSSPPPANIIVSNVSPDSGLGPVAETLAADNITTNSARMNGEANPNGLPTTAWFEWGTNSSYGNLTAPQNIGSGILDSNLNATLGGLVDAIQYHYRVVASNEFGVVTGNDMTFKVQFTPKPDVSPLDPMNFMSLGTLELSNGTFVIDTDALTISETNASSTNLLFTGAIDDQGGQADSFGPGTNVTTIGSYGIPYIAVFTFDSISLASSAVISVTGHRALALLSQGTAEIDTTLALNSQDLTNKPGPGGFPGGDETAFDGQGPGGAGAAVAQSTIQGVAVGGSAGFGSVGIEGYPTGGGITGGAAGSAYGDPSLSVLQGGSGGGSAKDTRSPLHLADGGGGGGALEIGAVDQLDLGANADIQARSEGVGTNAFAPLIQYYGGLGSGGGIVLSGQPVTVEGHVDVTSHIPVDDGYPLGFSTDGRIAVVGYQIPGITYYVPGVTSLQINTSHFSVGDGTLAVTGYGSFASSGWHTLVIGGHPLQLGSFSQITHYNDAGVNLYIENNANDITVWGGAEVTVPTNGVIFDGILELSGPTSLITGSGALTNDGLITGSGQIQTVLVNDAGGRVSAIENTLVFADGVTNEPGGKISAIDSTLDFNGGLDNLGALNLINTTVTGTVVNNGFTSLAGTNDFSGVVSGAGNFNGTGTAQFDGTYSPGNSPAAVTFAGGVAFSPTAMLHLELGGTNAGSEYDQLNVANDATLGGALDVVLIDGFVPAAGQVFHLINAGTRLGSFASVNLPTLPAGLEWQDNLNTDGTIAVIAPGGSGPQFGSVVLSGSGLVFSGSGGVTNGSYVLLSSTNVALPLLNWIPVSTNPFDANGDFLLTNPINPSQPQEFYRLQLQ